MIREFHQIDLSGRNSFGVGQQAARLAEFETEEDLRTIFSGGVPERWAVLSGGNNILFTRDYDGLLLTPVARQITPLGEEGDTVRVRADAGVEWDDLVEWAVERGLWGIENLSLIPGKAGAAPVQNIGAYGCEAKDVIERVHMFCTDQPLGNGHRRRTLLLRLPRKHLQARTAGARHHHGRGHPAFAHAPAAAGLRRRGTRGRSPRRSHAAQHPRSDLRHPPRQASRSEGDGQRGQLLQKPGRGRVRGAAAAGPVARHAGLPGRRDAPAR